MNIITLALDNALSNYNYLVYCDETREAMAVDPLEANQILNVAQSVGLKITTILNTHEHWDHIGGNEGLKAKTHAEIIAHHGAKKLIPTMDKGVKHDNVIRVGKTVAFKVLETPGHTAHHICLYCPKNAVIFTGDTLFNCGCGNCSNGGNPEDLYQTFENILKPLPDETKIYPGHDYIDNNLSFAMDIQPDLTVPESLQAKIDDHDAVNPYIATLKEDKIINPFFRLDDPKLIQALKNRRINLSENPSHEEVFLELRGLRNYW